MKMEKIVLVLDFSASSLAAARWIGAHLAPEAELALVHCLELPAAGSVLWDALPPRKELAPRLEAAAEERLRAVAAEIDAGRTRVHVRVGHPSEEVATVASEWDADLVVVGSHGLKSLIGDPLARLSRFLILSAPCSVLVVPEEENPP